MNRVNLNSKAGKLFWASLLLYCVGFCAFFFTTQYTLDRINYEEKYGAFLSFNEDICQHGKYCSNVAFENYPSIKKKKYSTLLDIQLKGKGKHLDMPALQNNYAQFIAKLPWFIKIQFDTNMAVRSVNGTKIKFDYE